MPEPKPPRQVVTRAEISTTRTANIERRREVSNLLLLDKLDGEKIVNALNKCAEDLEEVAADTSLEKRTLSPDEIATQSVRIKALSAAAVINFKRLAKLLPDLKAVQVVSNDDQGTPLEELAKAAEELDFIDIPADPEPPKSK